MNQPPSPPIDPVENGNELLAHHLYESYCRAVGGVNFKGDPLPDANEFFADESKAMQANGWRQVAADAVLYLLPAVPKDAPLAWAGGNDVSPEEAFVQEVIVPGPIRSGMTERAWRVSAAVEDWLRNTENWTAAADKVADHLVIKYKLDPDLRSAIWNGAYEGIRQVFVVLANETKTA